MQRILIPLFFVFALSSKAQILSQLYEDGELRDQIQFRDTLELNQHLKKLQIDWINQGYYFAGLDSVVKNDPTISIYLHKGAKGKARLTSYRGKKLHTYLSRQLQSYANNGFPFASIQLDSIDYTAEIMSGKMQIKPGPEIRYDSAYFFNQLKTSHSYVYQLLDIVPGDPFSEKNYRSISKKIERSSFMSVQRPTDLAFNNNTAEIFLDINEEASSSFQGVIGLQQVQNGKTTAVGVLKLDLQNLFRSGKQFRFAWERFAEESQSLSVFYKHPFFLESRISPSFSFDLLKQDTTFLTRKTGLGIHTYISPSIEIFLEYEATNGTLLSSSLETVRESGLADFKRRVYSLSLSKGQPFLFRRLEEGTAWNLKASGGTKDIERNLSLPDSYYDSIQSQTNFYRFEGAFTYQLRMWRRQSFYHHIGGGTIQNDELLRNELHRIGGLSTLRGFNEKEFFAKSYLLSRMEFRSFFENQSYAYIFYDQLMFSRGAQSDQPFGLGLGFALATSSGQFSFALAVGRSADQPISFSNMKAHFGYISRF